LDEKHLLVDGKPLRERYSTLRCISFTTPKSCLHATRWPYFYLPKMESHLEARLWNDIFKFAQKELGVAAGIDQGHCG